MRATRRHGESLSEIAGQVREKGMKTQSSVARFAGAAALALSLHAPAAHADPITILPEQTSITFTAGGLRWDNGKLNYILGTSDTEYAEGVGSILPPEQWGSSTEDVSFMIDGRTITIDLGTIIPPTKPGGVYGVNYNGGTLYGYLADSINPNVTSYLDLGMYDRLPGNIAPIASSVPEPSSALLMGSALAAAAAVSRRRKKEEPKAE